MAARTDRMQPNRLRHSKRTIEEGTPLAFANQYGNIHIVANNPVKMRFHTPEQMLEFINADHDLYSEKAEMYVFNYNVAGSICTYSVAPNEAADLVEEAKANGDYWGAFLGPGGHIWDDPSHECYREGQATNLDCCASLIQYDDWVLTENYHRKENTNDGTA